MNEEHPRRLTVIVVTSMIVLAVLVAGGALAFVLRGSAAKPAGASVPVSTTTIEKTDLSTSQTLSGTLGFGTASTVKGAGTGTITKLPAVGDTIALGAALYRVDDKPVPAFLGATPLFRQLGAPGLIGADVAVVADNLAALGFPTGISTIDPARATWTAKATAALVKWKKSIGLDPVGTLDVGQVVVLGGPVRVNSVTAQLGDAVAGPLFTVTSTTKVVTVPVKATEIAKVSVGAPVTVVLPDNTPVAAKITAISTVVDGGAGSAGQDSPAETTPTLTVTVAPDDPAALAALDYASVEVKVVTASRSGVLAVGIGALVALKEGGYAVQKPNGDFVAVTTGMFSRSLVEVSGAGITDGMTVVTAQ